MRLKDINMITYSMNMATINIAPGSAGLPGLEKKPPDKGVNAANAIPNTNILPIDIEKARM